MAFSPTVAVSRAGKTVTRRSPICFVSPAPAPPGAAASPPAICIGREPSMVTWPMPRAPIIPIMLSAAWSLLSESTRKLALVTTRSPAATPSSTSTASSKRPPRRTSRGTRRPSPPSANTTWRRPESSTAVLGTTRRSPALPALFERAHLLRREVPETEPLAAGARERSRGHPRLGERALPEPPFRLAREEVLALRGQELRAVEGEERIALADGLPGVVRVKLLDEAAHLERHLSEPALVEVEPADGADHLPARAARARAPGDADRRRPGGLPPVR